MKHAKDIDPNTATFLLKIGGFGLLILLFTACASNETTGPYFWFENYSDSSDKTVYNATGSEEVWLDAKDPINEHHPYLADFLAQGPDFIRTAYRINKTYQTPRQGVAKLIKYKKGKNSLVFTIREKGQVRYDTLQNRVHLGSTKKSGLLAGFHRKLDRVRAQFIPEEVPELGWLEGSLPRDTYSKVNYKSFSKKLYLTLGLLEKPAQVKIEVHSTKGKVLATLQDEELTAGEHEWKWRAEKKGPYVLQIEIDGQRQRQIIY